jgi:hypothetical protein
MACHSPIDIARRKAIDLGWRAVGAVDRQHSDPDEVEFASGDASRTAHLPRYRAPGPTISPIARKPSGFGMRA